MPRKEGTVTGGTCVFGGELADGEVGLGEECVSCSSLTGVVIQKPNKPNLVVIVWEGNYRVLVPHNLDHPHHNTSHLHATNRRQSVRPSHFSE